MPERLRHRRLDWSCSPADLLRSWPSDVPVFMLHAGARTTAAAPGWTLFSSPDRHLQSDDPEAADPLARLAAALAVDPDAPTGGPRAPFPPAWIGYLSYDLGRRFEPRADVSGPGRDDRGWPDYVLGWCPWALVHEHGRGDWHAYGRGPRWIGSPPSAVPFNDSFAVGAFTSSLPPDDYLAAVARTIEYIAAGDIYQANITQRLSAGFRGSTRGAAIRALERIDAGHGAYLELPGGRTLLSLSPELFLEVDPVGRTVVTRPIKGTRPSTVSADQLERSAKDAAELHMIVDLMRNDLGRVCTYGTVCVPAARRIETHRTVHHGVGEITGRLREDVAPIDLLAATFPPGSVTGAPKIRAMQIIDELEPVRRGPYCGAIGLIDARGGMRLNVAIRTLMITGVRPEGDFGRIDGILDYGAGGGIVADSKPADEYRESLDKAAVLGLTLEAPALRPG